jgi:hypothetical protein
MHAMHITLAQVDQGWRQPDYPSRGGSDAALIVVGVILMVVCRLFAKKMRERFGAAYDVVLLGGVLLLSGWTATKLAHGVLGWIFYFAVGYLAFAMMFMFFGLVGDDDRA